MNNPELSIDSSNQSLENYFIVDEGNFNDLSEKLNEEKGIVQSVRNLDSNMLSNSSEFIINPSWFL